MPRHIVRPEGFHRLGPAPDQWVRSDGTPVTEPSTLLRLRALRIPPGWTHVWASEEVDATVQATGVDRRDRTQYRYSAAASARASTEKFAKLIQFADALPAVRKTVSAHLRLGEPGVSDVLRSTAAVVRLLDRGLFRIGNDRYVRDNDTYGLTTLRRAQVRLDAARMTFDFVGKEHVEHHVVVEDGEAAPAVEGLLRQVPHPEDRLFAIGNPPTWRHIDSATVNSYLHSHGGCAVTAKVFRTWGATVAAATVAAGARVLEGGHRRRDSTLYAFDAAAQLLGNTPAVARASYVHPAALRVGTSAAVTGAVSQAISWTGTDDFRIVYQQSSVQDAVLGALRAV